MSQEELKDPQLMVDDIDSINNGETKGPRVQRLALMNTRTLDAASDVARFRANSTKNAGGATSGASTSRSTCGRGARGGAAARALARLAKALGGAQSGAAT